MKDRRKINVKARSFQVNIVHRETNEQQEGKECETRRQEVQKSRIHKPQSAMFYNKLVW